MISGIIKWLKDRQDNIVVPKTLAKCVFTEGGNNLQNLSSKALYKGTGGAITQLPSINPVMIMSDLNYSTEEQLTGKRWIDGKPIYQITITGTGNNSSGDNYKINNPINDLDVIANIDCAAKITSTVSAAAEVPNMQLSNGSILANYIQSENQFWLQQTQTSGNSVYEYKLTVLYTKTTDTADSPVTPPKVEAMHVYSTEEKVVGTWVDGKPVYQRTFVDIPITSLNTWIYLTNEGNIKELLFTSGCSIRDGEPIPFGIFNTGIYTTAIVRNNNLAVLMNGISGETYSIKNITIQYTKTTD